MHRNSMIATLMVAGLVVAGSAFAAGGATTPQASKASPKSVASADKRMEEAAKDVDHAVQTQGEQQVATRLAKMLNTTPDALIAERSQLDVSWGSLAIANMLAAKAGGSVTAEQLIQERKDGKGWGQIANSLNLKLGQVVSDGRSSGRVAEGKEAPEAAEKEMDHERSANAAAEKAEHAESHASGAREMPEPHGAGHGHGH